MATETNLMYDLAEGHNISLSGSMNEAYEEDDLELPEGYSYSDLLLSLSQKQREP